MNRAFLMISLLLMSVSAIASSGPCGGLTGGRQGRPFRAEFHCHDLQVLPNGGQIDEEVSGAMARDGQGRTYIEYSPFGQKAPTDIYMSDAAKGVSASWQVPPRLNKNDVKSNSYDFPVSKTVRIMHYTPVIPRQRTAAQEKADMEGPLCPIHQSESVACEELGTKVFSDLLVRGTLEKTTVRTGEAGNDRPFEITVETWYSPTLNTFISQTTNDPRTGEHIQTVDNIEEGEPDLSLFELPHGYVVLDTAPDLR